MSSKIHYVFDTNVIVSSLLFKNSKPAQAFNEELSDVLGRKKFDHFLTVEERDEFLETFVDRAILIDIIEKVLECRDPKDDKILELALNGQAQYIVSGDKDLLVLNPFRAVKIVTAEEFLKAVNL
jgi:uncharacterized protein